MFYSRDATGRINGGFANPQDFATEELPDDDPEVRTFLQVLPPRPPPRDPRDEIDDLKAAIAALIKKGALSLSEIEAEKDAAAAKAAP
jgi:hypothetical protein